MVERAQDRPRSSHRANALGDRDRLVTPHDCYRAAGRKVTPPVRGRPRKPAADEIAEPPEQARSL